MKTTVALLCLVTGSIANAAAPKTTRPADVLAEVAIAAPSAELARWQKAVTPISPTTTLPPVDTLAPMIGKLVNVPGLKGLDLSQPLELVMVNPQQYPQFAVLVGTVANVKDLTESLADTPVLTMRVKKKLVAIGAPKVLDLLAGYEMARAAKPPAHGIHAVVYVEPIYAQFGAVLAGLKPLVTGMQQQPGSPLTPEAMGNVFDTFVSGLQQTTELALDFDTPNAQPEILVTLGAKAGSAIDAFYAKQVPSDFALLDKLAAMPTSLVAAGHFNMSALPDFLMDMMFGKDPKNAAARSAWQELTGLMTGDIAMVGTFAPADKMEFQTLFSSRDVPRATKLMQVTQEAMTRNGLLEGKVKMVRTEKPPVDIDGVKAALADNKYDFTNLPAYKGKPVFSKSSAIAGWDNLVAGSTGDDALSIMRRLIGAAKRSTDKLMLGSAIHTSIDHARSAKESFWMTLDLGSLTQGQAQQVKAVTTFAFGFGPHAGHMRIGVGAQ